jgi:hypothetical protein
MGGPGTGWRPSSRVATPRLAGQGPPRLTRIFLLQAPMAQRQHSLPDECRLSTNNNVKISPVGCAAPQHGTPPASPQQATQSRRLLQETLSGPAPYPMIAVPEKGYWVDGTDHDVSFDHRGAPVLSHQTWRAKIETDDTGKCYRRFYVGRVSSPMLLARKRNVADCSTKHHHTCPDKSGGCFCIFNFRSNLWQRSSSSRSRSGLSDRTAIRPIQSSTRLLSLSGRTAPRPASDERKSVKTSTPPHCSCENVNVRTIMDCVSVRCCGRRRSSTCKKKNGNGVGARRETPTSRIFLRRSLSRGISTRPLRRRQQLRG